MLASASAAAIATLAITVAVPALADDPAGPKGPDDLAACLRDNGLAGVPDGEDLKPWLGPRLERDDAAARRARAEPWLCLLYTSPSPRDLSTSRMPSSA